MTNRTLNKSRFTYRICDRCGIAGLDPLPAARQAEALYGPEYFTHGAYAGYGDYLGDEPVHRRNAQRRLALMRSSGSVPPGPLLDVGCAAGFFMAEAMKQGWDVHGMDVSPWAAQQVQRTLGLHIFRSFSEIPRELAGQFSVITMFQTLEHSPDPPAMLRDARALLRSNGLLFIETWDRDSRPARVLGAAWHQVSPPSVVWLFGCRSLSPMLERAGFRLESWRRTSKEVSLGFIAQQLAQKHPFLRRLFASCTGRGRLARLAVLYRLGDLVTVTARPWA